MSLGKVTIFDASTGETEEREFSSEELAAHQEVITDQAQALTDTQSRIEARTSALDKLAALGLTEEEIAAL